MDDCAVYHRPDSRYENCKRARSQVNFIEELIDDRHAFVPAQIDRVVRVLIGMEQGDFMLRIDRLVQRALFLESGGINGERFTKTSGSIGHIVAKNIRILKIVADGAVKGAEVETREDVKGQLESLLVRLIDEPHLFLPTHFGRLLVQTKDSGLERLLVDTLETELNLRSRAVTSLQKSDIPSMSGLSPLARYRSAEIMRVHISDRIEALRALDK